MVTSLKPSHIKPIVVQHNGSIQMSKTLTTEEKKELLLSNIPVLDSDAGEKAANEISSFEDHPNPKITVEVKNSMETLVLVSLAAEVSDSEINVKWDALEAKTTLPVVEEWYQYIHYIEGPSGQPLNVGQRWGTRDRSLNTTEIQLIRETLLGAIQKHPRYNEIIE